MLDGTADGDGAGGRGAGRSLGYGGGGRARPLGVEGGAGISRAGQKSAGRARRGSALDSGDALLDGTADGDSSGGRGAGRSLGYGGGRRARPLGVKGGAGVSRAGLKSAGRARRGNTLEDEVDNKGNPILLGVRPDDQVVTVDGMSDGTRDQLYLALRLATLEQHLQHGEPMPFVVDDILVGFDDDRTKACLQVLAELANSTQVLVFTHHRRVAEIAHSLGDGIFVHELPKRPVV